MRLRFVTIFCLLLSLSSSAQLQSPESFLGYSLGSRYTPHWRLVEYYRHAAATMPSMVKLQEYGKTNEGRPLLVVFISDPANLSNLETIRKNNLALTGLSSGDANSAALPIVWLSYNVHGNETSSSEASMMTLYALLNPSNTQAKQWLKNTVVVIDPCINPDGRDRYVNWFNSVIGSQYNPSLDAREHREPWPGGRTNHYNFDLNRDWAWQTQIETQQRLKLYQQWMPEVHVDFHEQGINNPYYFAPAAQPYHEVITPWQRDFQVTIGRNHARYFDQKGWLFFTREVFDLLYPSYGDTYPIYNGAIGMTYEQGGGPAGGAAALMSTGDTLTLLDRIQHHYTTGISTIETASANAAKLTSEFKKFFTDARNNGVGAYKTYVIPYNAQEKPKLDALLELLDKNGISYGSFNAKNARGFNYQSGKEEAISISDKTLAVSTAQPRGTLVSVLFEPNTAVVDSNTYDITAWSLPYVYGLRAYALRERVSLNNFADTNSGVTQPMEDPYAFVFPWSGLKSVKLATSLAKKGIKLRVSELPFESGGAQFSRGSVIILKTGNQYQSDLWNTVRTEATKVGVTLTAVKSGFVDQGFDFGSSRIRPFRARKVALLTGEGVGSNAAGEVWHYFDKQLEYPLTLINLNDIGRIRWSDYDVLIMPDGNYRFLSDKTQTDALKNWIQGGGHLVALESAVAQLARQDWSIKSKKADDSDSKDTYGSLRKYEDRERDFIPTLTPGSIYKVDLDNSHPLAFGYPNYYYTLKQDDRIYDFIKEDGWNVGVIKKSKQVAGFVGSKLQPKLQDGLLFGVQDMGNGTITYLADDLLFRSFWENGKLMFANAVFLVGQ